MLQLYSSWGIMRTPFVVCIRIVTGGSDTCGRIAQRMTGDRCFSVTTTRDVSEVPDESQT